MGSGNVPWPMARKAELPLNDEKEGAAEEAMSILR
jgi:hypothetical protein